MVESDHYIYCETMVSLYNTLSGTHFYKNTKLLFIATEKNQR